MQTRRAFWVLGLSASLAVTGCPADEGGTVQDGGRGTNGDATGTQDRTLPNDGASQGDGASMDANVVDGAGRDSAGADGAASDGGTSGDDAGRADAAEGAACEAREVCADGLDNNCNGRVDEDCPCTPGMEQRCFPSRYEARGVCQPGRQVCMGAGEFGRWSQCQGAIEPGPEVCDGLDNDCNGTADDGISRSCYTGPMGTRGVGPCHDGTQRCEMGAFGTCVGEATPTDETCDGVDNNCNGTTDESVSRGCYPGPDGTEGRGLCRAGGQTCTAGTFGECTGAVTPAAEVCDGMDNDCNGMVDEGLTRTCYSGPMGTVGVGVCRSGTQACTMGSFGACAGAVVPGVEVCGNGTDDDCDGMTDEDCRPCIAGMASSAPWQIHRVMGPVCFGRTFSTHGERGEYDLATIPSETDAGWRAVTSTTIDFSDSSSLCGRACTCLNGGEFTYFQTFFDVSPGFAVTSLSVAMAGVDDGARVTVFNSMYPTGIVDPGSYVLLGGTGTSTDLARYIVRGRNRIVITHIDDCCSARSLTGVRVVLNGASLTTCP